MKVDVKNTKSLALAIQPGIWVRGHRNERRKSFETYECGWF